MHSGVLCRGLVVYRLAGGGRGLVLRSRGLGWCCAVVAAQPGHDALASSAPRVDLHHLEAVGICRGRGGAHRGRG